MTDQEVIDWVDKAHSIPLNKVSRSLEIVTRTINKRLDDYVTKVREEERKIKLFIKDN
ncbi:MAG: hypothetical protein COA63_014005 [Methylophaga sp.]|nr:hypothetical protein [Methylophaga sp.]